MDFLIFLYRAALVGGGCFALLIAVYWFNLDNKLIFYVVRPLMNKIYDSHKRDVRL